MIRSCLNQILTLLSSQRTLTFFHASRLGNDNLEGKGEYDYRLQCQAIFLTGFP